MLFEIILFGLVLSTSLLPVFCDVQCLPDNKCKADKDCSNVSRAFNITKWTSSRDDICSICTADLREFPRNCNEKVTCIVLHYTCIESVLSEHLRYYPDLQSLTLDNNQLRYLGSSLFQHNKKLSNLKVNHENLNGSLAVDVFLKATNLQHIELVDNQITDLPTSIFDDLINLTHLSLSWNAITEIKPWEMEHVTEFNIANNRLTSWPTDIELTHLKSLDLSHNRFETWVSITMPSLHKLHLSDNKIRVIEQHAFQMNRNLRILDLRNNDIETLPTNLFDNLCHLTSLDLSGNRLKTIQVTWFGSLVQNCQADVKMKLPRCDSGQSELKTFLRSVENHNQQTASCKNNFEIFCSDQNTPLKNTDLECADSKIPDIKEYYFCECSANNPLPFRPGIKTKMLPMIAAFGVCSMLLIVFIATTCKKTRCKENIERKSKNSESFEDSITDDSRPVSILINDQQYRPNHNSERPETECLSHPNRDPNETTPKQFFDEMPDYQNHNALHRSPGVGHPNPGPPVPCRNRVRRYLVPRNRWPDFIENVYGYFNVQTRASYNPRS